MAPPYVVKPNNEGSSVGVYIVAEGANARRSSPTTCRRRVLVEEYVAGRELTTAVMGDRALAVTDIIADGWYDYHAKYAPGGSRHVVPADSGGDHRGLPRLRAARPPGARLPRGQPHRLPLGRAAGLGGLVLLEINTQPGMTPTSLAPEQAAYRGIPSGSWCAGWWRTPRAPGEGRPRAATRRRRGCATG